MSHVVDDVVNPIGAITGVDPVRSITGFNGTGFDPKPAATGGTTAVSGGGGGSSSGGGSNALMQLAGQQVLQGQAQSQSAPFSQFGQQLSQLATQIAPPVRAQPTLSSTDLAASITANSVHAAQTAPPGHQPRQQQNFWAMSPTANTFQ